MASIDENMNNKIASFKTNQWLENDKIITHDNFNTNLFE